MQETIEIGSRRELFADDFLIAHLDDGLSRKLHEPTREEIVLRTDRPWEGCMSTYITVFRDEDIFRMYYTGWELDLASATDADGAMTAESHPMWVCYAKSEGGRDWRRPELKLIEYNGSTENNIRMSQASRDGSHR